MKWSTAVTRARFLKECSDCDIEDQTIDREVGVDLAEYEAMGLVLIQSRQVRAGVRSISDILT